MKFYILICFLVSMMIVTSGCIAKDGSGPTSNAEDKNSQSRQETNSKPYVVVAYIDSGINPYHVVFRRPNSTTSPLEMIYNYPQNTTAINLTFGNDYTSCFENDYKRWQSLEKKKLYYIPGTCIVGAISFSQDYSFDLYELPGLPILADSSPHGNYVASAVVENNPDVFLVVVECGSKDLKEGLDWCANQSWIDIVSLSFGFQGGVNIPYYVWQNVSESTLANANSGKTVISGAGNRDVPNWFGDVAGPPWVIAIGGSNNNTKGDAIVAARMPEFVSDFTISVAKTESIDEYCPVSGTSMSAPSAAGVISRVLLDARQRLNYTFGIKNGYIIDIPENNIHIKNTDLRTCLNKTAIYWNTTAYNPRNHTIFDDPPMTLVSLTAPVLPVAPFLQMGWGYIGPEIVNETVDILLGKKEWTPSLEKQLAEPYMNAVYELRKQFWGNWPMSEK